MSDQRTAYYRDWSVSPSDEVSEEEAGASYLYARAFLARDDAVTRLELYSGGRLVEVVYYEKDLGDVLPIHLRDYPGVELTTRHDLMAAGRFHWVLSRRYTPTGELRGLIMSLLQPDQVAPMELNAEPGGEIVSIMKYFYDSPDHMQYSFEYDRAGRYTAGYELETHDSVKLAEVLPHLPDPEFYERGYELPREIRGTSIPPFGDAGA